VAKRNVDPLKLILFLLAVYAPFMGFRVARTAGDEKVYVAQALEMERAGNWFLQRLAGEANYYKGPLHYILLRFGSAFFGHTMWATVYMNLALLLLGAYSLYRLGRRYLPERPKGLAVFAGAAFGVSAGVYGYMFASQMEAELACAFAIALNLFERSLPRAGRSPESSRKAEWAFWLVVGLTGWFKSPLYSALLGASALLAWAREGLLRAKLRDSKAWQPIGAGILLCSLGYAPPLIWDRQAYLHTYWYRETFGKGDNGGSWWEAVFALTTSFLFPWCLLAWWAFAHAIGRYSRKSNRTERAPGLVRLERVCLAWLAPTLLFFIFFPYHGQSYNVPILGPLILWMTLELSQARARWNKILYVALAGTALFFAGFAAFESALFLRVRPAPEWLWPITLPFGAIASAVSGGAFLLAARNPRSRNWTRLVFSTLGFFLAFGLLLANVGDRELVDLRREIPAGSSVVYAELGHNLWSEWGYLGFMLPLEVSAVYDEESLGQALASGRRALVPGEDALRKVRQVAQARYPFRKLVERRWRRWKMQGQDDSGTALWRVAWRNRDPSVLERDYFVVFFDRAGAP
jgi:4-amino-4-deoxy-L-arabinose transferase-like glycosyltransferase